jgi:hypothetical protein
MKQAAAALLLLILFVAFGSSACADTTPEGDSRRQFLTKVQQELTRVQDLAKYNRTMRIWSDGIALTCTAIVTILTGLTALNDGKIDQRWFRIATLVVSGLATAATVIPKTFHLTEEEIKYNRAIGNLS